MRPIAGAHETWVHWCVHFGMYIIPPKMGVQWTVSFNTGRVTQVCLLLQLFKLLRLWAHVFALCSALGSSVEVAWDSSSHVVGLCRPSCSANHSRECVAKCGLWCLVTGGSRSLRRQDCASLGHSGKSSANAASCRASGWPLSCFSISAVTMPAQDGVFQQVWEDMSSIAWCPRCHGFRQSTLSSHSRLLQWWRPCDWHSWISVCGMG